MAAATVDKNARSEVSATTRRRRRSLYDILFSPFTACFAVFALLLSFFLPTDGVGITICWIKAYTDLPCPGCGLTRSITCLSQFQFVKAWNYHPFGPLIYALFVANAMLLVLPRSKKTALKRQFRSHDRWLKPIYMALVLSFLTFGILRMLFIAYAV